MCICCLCMVVEHYYNYSNLNLFFIHSKDEINSNLYCLICIAWLLLASITRTSVSNRANMIHLPLELQIYQCIRAWRICFHKADDQISWTDEVSAHTDTIFWWMAGIWHKQKTERINMNRYTYYLFESFQLFVNT